MEPLFEDDVHYSVQNGNVRADILPQMEIGEPGQGDLAGVDQEQLRSPFPGIDDALTDEPMLGGGVGSGDQEQIRVFELINGIRHRVRTECGGQTDHRGAVPETGAMIDIVGSEGGPGHFHEEVVLLVDHSSSRNRRRGTPLVSLPWSDRRPDIFKLRVREYGAVDTAIFIAHRAVAALPDAAFHHPLQGHEDMIRGKADVQQFLENESVHDRGIAQHCVGVTGGKGGAVKQPRDHPHVLFPDSLCIPVHAVEVLNVVPVEKLEALIFEQDVIRVVRSVHQHNVIELIPLVEDIQEQGTERCKPDSARDKEEFMALERLQGKSPAIRAPDVKRGSLSHLEQRTRYRTGTPHAQFQCVGPRRREEMLKGASPFPKTDTSTNCPGSWPKLSHVVPSSSFNWKRQSVFGSRIE